MQRAGLNGAEPTDSPQAEDMQFVAAEDAAAEPELDPEPHRRGRHAVRNPECWHGKSLCNRSK